jgi:outer membrane lipoprotein-sorting protein
MIRKRIQDVLLYVTRDRLLPVKMQWREPDGDSTTISFEEVRLNPEIQASVYKIALPKDVEVIKKRVPGADELKEKGEG